ncbi:uncharacterized protein L969DRAFT_96792 [Mixia osmundae IAM 14324]|uniref:Uncharacterized protein n=1 Tax=Mixia osmundae (strain CBS 9802 / IAM 14324 / JCM 22182 / KY 12970) TaxID=764103 RepID=G7E240_MIXOS|nr:uncharacterized protein L969DRAFT_96792 [Mixia osmundae IAM 14324]KEI36770.1 hypothetical protein L969DRAFT_96792 [Mixia osmundae IAM 14324]GAA96900.1 hypothetical protein E5Q_03573 [Mixia osmundae IAM 14324]
MSNGRVSLPASVLAALQHRNGVFHVPKDLISCPFPDCRYSSPHRFKQASDTRRHLQSACHALRIFKPTRRSLTFERDVQLEPNSIFTGTPTSCSPSIELFESAAAKPSFSASAPDSYSENAETSALRLPILSPITQAQALSFGHSHGTLVDPSFVGFLPDRRLPATYSTNHFMIETAVAADTRAMPASQAAPPKLMAAGRRGFASAREIEAWELPDTPSETTQMHRACDCHLYRDSWPLLRTHLSPTI